jgi:hypothetical protein
MIQKPPPPWNVDEGSPCARQSVRPTVWEVARAYRGVALVYVPMYAILGLFPAAFIIFALNWIVATVGGLSLIDYSGGQTDTRRCGSDSCRMAVGVVWALVGGHVRADPWLVD